VVDLGTFSILSFLEQMLHGEMPCFRMKLLFLGQENVGYESTTTEKERDRSRIASSSLIYLRPLAKHRSLGLSNRVSVRIAREFALMNVSPVISCSLDVPVTHFPLSGLPPPSLVVAWGWAVSTDGIDISEWSMNILHGMERSVKIANWDFAGNSAVIALVEDFFPGVSAIKWLRNKIPGQEIYYATHQLFLSERSVFLIVFNLASPMHNYIKFWSVFVHLTPYAQAALTPSLWLCRLESVHKRAPGSPVVLVGTHADDERCSEEYLETIRHEM